MERSVNNCIIKVENENLVLLEIGKQDKIIDENVHSHFTILNPFDNENYRVLYFKSTVKGRTIGEPYDILCYTHQDNSIKLVIQNVKNHMFYMENEIIIKFVCCKKDETNIIIYEEGKDIIKLEKASEKHTVLQDNNGDIKILFYQLNGEHYRVCLYENNQINNLMQIDSEFSSHWFRNDCDFIVVTGSYTDKEIMIVNEETDEYIDTAKIGKYLLYDERCQSLFKFDSVDFINNHTILYHISGDSIRNMIGYGSITSIENNDTFRIISFQFINKVKIQNHHYIIGNICIYDNYELYRIIENVICFFNANSDGTKILHYRLDNAKINCYIYDLYSNKNYLLCDNISLESFNNVIYDDFFNETHIKVSYNMNYELLESKIGMNLKEKPEFEQIFSQSAMSEKNSLSFYFKDDNSKSFYMAKKVVQKEGELVLLENKIEDDDSRNYMAIFKKTDIDTIRLFYKILSSGTCLGTNLFGFDSIILAYNCDRMGSTKNNRNEIGFYHAAYHVKFASILNGFYTFRKIDNYEIFSETKKIIMEQYGYDNEKQFFRFIYSNYVEKVIDSINEVVKFLKQANSELTYDEIKAINLEIKMKETGLYEELVENKCLTPKWKSEYDMFKTIKGVFPDALLHYSDRWLELQHLDVFIPSHNLAFEYQGVQHFSSIDFFGGEEALSKRIALDNLKRDKCKKNGIVLIEWNYEEPVTKPILLKKLKELNIEINKK